MPACSLLALPGVVVDIHNLVKFILDLAGPWSAPAGSVQLKVRAGAPPLNEKGREVT